MLEAIVATYPTAGERAYAASVIVHEIQRRNRRSVMTSSTLKVCPDCNNAKTHADYRRDASRADGLDGFCRPCRVARG